MKSLIGVLPAIGKKSRFKRLPDRRLPEGYDPRGENGGILRTVDGNGGHGDSRRHLNGRKEGVKSLELPGSDRHADYRQKRLGRDGPGKMRRHSGAGDKNLDATAFRRGAVSTYKVRRAVGGCHLDFASDSKRFQSFDNRFGNFFVTGAAYKNSNLDDFH